MKRWLFAGVAAAALAAATTVIWAADGPVKALPAPPYIPPLEFSWTGFYVGANIGGGWASANITDTLTGTTFGSNTRSAFIGGGQIGYNYQVVPYLVLGIEWFMDGVAGNNSNNNNAVLIPALHDNLFAATAKTDWISTLTGRIGITGPLVAACTYCQPQFGADRWLFYAKGGGAWVETQATVADLTTGVSASTTQTHIGWVAGLGIEWAFLPNWTAKVDYQYIWPGSFSTTPGFVVDTFDVNRVSIQTVTVGFNYLFNWSAPASIAARY